MKSLTCMCETSFEADIADELDLDTDQRALKAIRDGSFMSYPCPNCGKILKPEMPVSLLSAKLGLKLLFIPEIDRLSFYNGKYPVAQDFECVIGFPELLDRVRALSDGFDHRAIEIMKYIFLCKAQESDPEAQIRVFYHGIEKDQLVFHIHGLSRGDIAVIKAPKSLYDMSLKDIPEKSAQEPFSTMLKRPYVSVHRLEMED